MNGIEDTLRQMVAENLASFVAGLESVGLRRDIVLAGLEQGLKELRKAEPKRH